MARLDEGYREDLAYIHDAGFGQIATAAADVVVEQLGARLKSHPKVIDLGCGSGILARRLADAGCQVLGIDQSAAMIERSRQRVPEGTFLQQSFLDVDLPSAVAITAVGEIVSYLFDSQNGWNKLRGLLRRIHASLEPGGLLIFDFVAPGRAPAPEGKRGFQVGVDWVCLFSQVEVPREGTLRRQITTFRRVGSTYRRDDETHLLRLYDPAKVAAELRRIGFRARRVRRYGDFIFPPGLIGFIARKR